MLNFTNIPKYKFEGLKYSMLKNLSVTSYTQRVKAKMLSCVWDFQDLSHTDVSRVYRLTFVFSPKMLQLLSESSTGSK